LASRSLKLPLGGNVGITSPYIRTRPPTSGNPNGSGTRNPRNLGEGEPDYVNGQAVTYTVDGMEVSRAIAMSFLRSGLGTLDPENNDPFLIGHIGGIIPNYGYREVDRHPEDDDDPNSGGDDVKIGTVYIDLERYIASYTVYAVSWSSQQQSQQNAGGGGQQDGLNKGKKASFNMDNFNKCLKKYFPGVTFENISDGRTQSLGFSRETGGNFAGNLNGQVFSVVTNVSSRNSSTLGRQLKAVGGNPSGVDQSGATFGSSPNSNFIASDVASDSRNLNIGLFGLFIHELGNSLGKISGLADPFNGFAQQNSKLGIKDPDVGAAFESCVFGGLVGLRSGRVGSRREFF